MKFIQKIDRIERPNYWRLLPPKMYWAGTIMEFSQAVGMIWLMIETTPLAGFISSFGIASGLLILRPHYEGEPLHDSWKLSCFAHTLGMVVFQILLTITGPLL